MSKVTKIETALRYLLVCAIFASPLLPAQAQQQAQTSGPQQVLTQASAPLFTQLNYMGDLRQHSFFAGSTYRLPITTSVGYNEQPLFYYDNPTIQTVYPGPTPLSTGLIGDNINTTVESSVPGLVTSAAVTGAVVGAAAVGSVASAGSSTATSAASSASNQSVNGTIDSTQF